MRSKQIWSPPDSQASPSPPRAAQFGDLDLDIARRGRHGLGAVAITVARAFRGTLIAVHADPFAGLGLDQRLSAWQIVTYAYEVLRFPEPGLRMTLYIGRD